MIPISLNSNDNIILRIVIGNVHKTLNDFSSIENEWGSSYYWTGIDLLNIHDIHTHTHKIDSTEKTKRAWNSMCNAPATLWLILKIRSQLMIKLSDKFEMTIRRKGNSIVHRTTSHKIEILLTKYRRNCVEKENVNAECEGRLNIFINSIRFSQMQLNFGANAIQRQREKERERKMFIALRRWRRRRMCRFFFIVQVTALLVLIAFAFIVVIVALTLFFSRCIMLYHHRYIRCRISAEKETRQKLIVIFRGTGTYIRPI